VVFVNVNANGPPATPVVVFRRVTVGRIRLLVKSQVNADPAPTEAAGIVYTLPVRDPTVVPKEFTQIAEDNCQPADEPSVIFTSVPIALTVNG
jgi:hypothetical protein